MTILRVSVPLAALGLACAWAVLAQPTTPDVNASSAADPLDGRDGRPLALDQFRPESSLVVQRQSPQRARYPVVDVHIHPKIRLHESTPALDDFVRLMDSQNIAVCVSLDGGLGERFEEHSACVWQKHHDRFVIFANVDWQGAAADGDWANWDCQRPDFVRRTVRALEEAKARGASGLKIFKDFGLRYRNPDGSLVTIDDPRWDGIWAACGRLELPVLIHVADPLPFFQPIDQRNERWEELHRHPEWSFHGPDQPKHDEVTAAFLRVVERHPRTTFIGAHLASSEHDLGQLAQWLARYKNLNVEIASRINDLGRQPYTARKFLIEHADRVMLGTDGPRAQERLVRYWQFCETFDEYFPYAETAFPPQGFWNIYGVGLPDDVLRKIYHENAARLIPGVRERLSSLK